MVSWHRISYQKGSLKLRNENRRRVYFLCKPRNTQEARMAATIRPDLGGTVEVTVANVAEEM